MASSSFQLLFAFSVAFAFISSMNAADPNPPVLNPLRKDAATLQYCTTLNLGSPSYKLNAVIDLALLARSGSVNLRIYGANSVGSLKKDVVCLGFVDGGLNPRTSIVIGGHQWEDNLLEFDLGYSTLRFSSSLCQAA